MLTHCEYNDVSKIKNYKKRRVIILNKLKKLSKKLKTMVMTLLVMASTSVASYAGTANMNDMVNNTKSLANDLLGKLQGVTVIVVIVLTAWVFFKHSMESAEDGRTDTFKTLKMIWIGGIGVFVASAAVNYVLGFYM